MEAELKAIFKLADKDGNGTLSPEEIRTQLLTPSPYKKITEKEVEIALKELDLDSDGKVSCQGKFLKFFNFLLSFFYGFEIFAEFIEVITKILSKVF